MKDDDVFSIDLVLRAKEEMLKGGSLREDPMIKIERQKEWLTIMRESHPEISVDDLIKMIADSEGKRW